MKMAVQVVSGGVASNQALRGSLQTLTGACCLRARFEASIVCRVHVGHVTDGARAALPQTSMG
jgi:hypothetical protein